MIFREKYYLGVVKEFLHLQSDKSLWCLGYKSGFLSNSNTNRLEIEHKYKVSISERLEIFDKDYRGKDHHSVNFILTYYDFLIPESKALEICVILDIRKGLR